MTRLLLVEFGDDQGRAYAVAPYPGADLPSDANAELGPRTGYAVH
jgi:hypothetical protein